METASKTPQMLTNSNEALSKVLNYLCNVRKDLFNAELTEEEQRTITPRLNDLCREVERCYIERIKKDFPIAEDDTPRYKH